MFVWESSPHFSMWWAVTDSRGPTRSLHICWRIYDQVVSGLGPSLGNTTPVLLMEEILYLITSAGAQPVISLTVQNKLAGSLIDVITHMWWYSVWCCKYYVYCLHPAWVCFFYRKLVIVLPNMLSVTERRTLRLPGLGLGFSVIPLDSWTQLLPQERALWGMGLR